MKAFQVFETLKKSSKLVLTNVPKTQKKKNQTEILLQLHQ